MCTGSHIAFHVQDFPGNGLGLEFSIIERGQGDQEEERESDFGNFFYKILFHTKRFWSEHLVETMGYLRYVLIIYQISSSENLIRPPGGMSCMVLLFYYDSVNLCDLYVSVVNFHDRETPACRPCFAEASAKAQ
jgi:hypothetical protein